MNHKIAPQYLGVYIIHGEDYLSGSAGLTCLYLLADMLIKRGYIVFTTHVSLIAHHLKPAVISLDFARFLSLKYSIPVIYPEVIYGNPLNAKTVIRWVLNKPGFLGGDKVYDNNELVFVYSDFFAAHVQNQIAGRLYVLTIDESIFHRHGAAPLEKRQLECYYIGKSSFKEGFFDVSKTRLITRLSPDRKTLGNWLRECKVLYCFDNSSIITYEAILCGCPVVVIPDGTQTRLDYEKSEFGMDGLAWGLEEYEQAKKTVKTFADRYINIKAGFEQDLEIFISKTNVCSTIDPFLPMVFESLRLFTCSDQNSEQICPRPICLWARMIEKYLPCVSVYLDFLSKKAFFLIRFLYKFFLQRFQCQKGDSCVQSRKKSKRGE